MWRKEPAVGITWQDGRTTRHSIGTVVLALPRPEDPDVRPEPWGFPDAALVRVPGTRKASCVLLAELPPPAPPGSACTAGPGRPESWASARSTAS